jgi:phenylacetate-coenzyme A ligase PaaK-like adenylate-forming protein
VDYEQNTLHDTLIGSFWQEGYSVKTKVSLVQPGSIPRSEGKAKRVVDKRVI